MASSSASSDVEQKILDQIEFYFSNSNLVRDRFLRNEIKKNDDGWVPIATLATFKRVEALSKDVEVITNALRKSTELDVSEDGKGVKRKVPLPAIDEAKKEIDTRTLYAKGFPTDNTVTIDGLKAFFSTHGKVLSVRLRRLRDKKFKGSALIEFSTKEEAETASKATIKYPDDSAETPLELMMKNDWWAEKEASRAETKNKRKAPEPSESETKKEERKKGDYPRNKILALTGLQKNYSAHEIRNIFSELGFKVAYCNVIGGGRYEVRFEDAVDTVPMLKAFNDSGCKIGDEVAKAEMITGDEEKAIWERILAGGAPKGKKGRKRHKKNK